MPPLVAGAPAEPVTHRAWSDEWVAVRCAACGHEADWPHPEVGCACGTVLRVRVHPVGADEAEAGGYGADGPGKAATGHGAASETPYETPYEAQHEAPYEIASGGGPATGTAPPRATDPAPTPLPATAPVPAVARAPFRPRTIRTAQDAVAAVAVFLRWLGFHDVLRPEGRSSGGIDLRGPGLVAQVDASTRPVGTRAVECLWLNGLSASSVGVLVSLAGYTSEARARADDIGVALFVLDLTGTPQPLNQHADELLG